ncbi:MAG: HIT family protein [Bacteroidales bacterium]|nr:MAG: HIT family protein [Bacteroidales bacterium]
MKSLKSRYCNGNYFSKIIAGEIPCYKVAEDEKNFAFLDINPVNKGHVLVVPKTENDYIFNLSDDDYQSLTMFARRVAKAIDKALPCKRVGVAVIGLEVPHAHIHLIPIVEEKDMYFDKQKLTLPAEEMQAIADAIAKEM